MTIDYFAGDDRTRRERMLAGDLYIGGTDPESVRLAQRAVQLADAYHRAAVADEAAARPILVDLLGTLGEDAFVKPPLYVDYGENIHIGARTFINYNLTALDVATISIGADCMIGPNVQLLSPRRTRPIRNPAGTNSRRRSRSPSATTSGSAAASSCAPGSRSPTTAWSAPAPRSPATSPRASSAWAARGRPGSIDVPDGTPLLLIEGERAGRRETRDLIDTVVWIVADAEQTGLRCLARDGDTPATTAFMAEWAREELPFFADQQVWRHAQRLLPAPRPRARPGAESRPDASTG